MYKYQILVSLVYFTLVQCQTCPPDSNQTVIKTGAETIADNPEIIGYFFLGLVLGVGLALLFFVLFLRFWCCFWSDTLTEITKIDENDWVLPKIDVDKKLADEFEFDDEICPGIIQYKKPPVSSQDPPIQSICELNHVDLEQSFSSLLLIHYKNPHTVQRRIDQLDVMCALKYDIEAANWWAKFEYFLIEMLISLAFGKSSEISKFLIGRVNTSFKVLEEKCSSNLMQFMRAELQQTRPNSSKSSSTSKLAVKYDDWLGDSDASHRQNLHQRLLKLTTTQHGNSMIEDQKNAEYKRQFAQLTHEIYNIGREDRLMAVKIAQDNRLEQRRRELIVQWRSDLREVPFSILAELKQHQNLGADLSRFIWLKHQIDQFHKIIDEYERRARLQHTVWLDWMRQQRIGLAAKALGESRACNAELDLIKSQQVDVINRLHRANQLSLEQKVEYTAGIEQEQMELVGEWAEAHDKALAGEIHEMNTQLVGALAEELNDQTTQLNEFEREFQQELAQLDFANAEASLQVLMDVLDEKIRLNERHRASRFQLELSSALEHTNRFVEFQRTDTRHILKRMQQLTKQVIRELEHEKVDEMELDRIHRTIHAREYESLIKQNRKLAAMLDTKLTRITAEMQRRMMRLTKRQNVAVSSMSSSSGGAAWGVAVRFNFQKEGLNALDLQAALSSAERDTFQQRLQIDMIRIDVDITESRLVMRQMLEEELLTTRKTKLADYMQIENRKRELEMHKRMQQQAKHKSRKRRQHKGGDANRRGKHTAMASSYYHQGSRIWQNSPMDDVDEQAWHHDVSEVDSEEEREIHWLRRRHELQQLTDKLWLLRNWQWLETGSGSNGRGDGSSTGVTTGPDVTSSIDERIRVELSLRTLRSVERLKAAFGLDLSQLQLIRSARLVDIEETSWKILILQSALFTFLEEVMATLGRISTLQSSVSRPPSNTSNRAGGASSKSKHGSDVGEAAHELKKHLMSLDDIRYRHERELGQVLKRNGGGGLIVDNDAADEYDDDYDFDEYNAHGGRRYEKSKNKKNRYNSLSPNRRRSPRKHHQTRQEQLEQLQTVNDLRHSMTCEYQSSLIDADLQYAVRLMNESTFGGTTILFSKQFFDSVPNQIVQISSQTHPSILLKPFVSSSPSSSPSSKDQKSKDFREMEENFIRILDLTFDAYFGYGIHTRSESGKSIRGQKLDQLERSSLNRQSIKSIESKLESLHNESFRVKSSKSQNSLNDDFYDTKSLSRPISRASQKSRKLSDDENISRSSYRKSFEADHDSDSLDMTNPWENRWRPGKVRSFTNKLNSLDNDEDDNYLDDYEMDKSRNKKSQRSFLPPVHDAERINDLNSRSPTKTDKNFSHKNSRFAHKEDKFELSNNIRPLSRTQYNRNGVGNWNESDF